MNLTFEEFSSQAREFVKMSDSLDDGWKLREDPDGNRYLHKKRYHCLTIEDLDQPDVHPTEGVTEFKDEQVDREREDNRKTFIWEYSIAYSVSYEVPALYFNVSQVGSTAPLSLDEVWNFCRKYGAVLGMDRANLWSTITQQEHPVTGVPHFVLHPCNTQKMMQQLSYPMQLRKENYLLTWLSSVAPAVGIRMPLDYLECVQRAH